jgi:proteasome lid subunit RPN8/RPN11
MMKIPKAAIEHAKQCYPNESCGIVVDGRYLPCRNDAKDPSEQFVMNREDYRHAIMSGEPNAIIHSHPNGSKTATDVDRVSCEETDLPWGIIWITRDDTGQFYAQESWIKPSGFEASLIGRPYVWGVFDCLSIVLDYYKREMGIDLGGFERPDQDWSKGSTDIYTAELTAKGFYKTQEQPKQGDIVLMKIRSKVPNHAAIFLENGILSTEPEHYPAPMSILHHLEAKSSKRDIYGGYWAEKTVSIWRHKNSKPSGSTAS